MSGEIAQEPVVSVKSGHVFEKRLLEKWLASNEDRCPITKEVLQKNDILPLKSKYFRKICEAKNVCAFIKSKTFFLHFI